MEETVKDVGNKDIDEDEELAALRLAALATLKHRRKENINETSTSQSLPINSIVSAASKVAEPKNNHIPFVQSDRTLYNVHSWRKQSQPIRRRGGPFPKTSHRSNLIVISPVSLEGNNGSDHKPASAIVLPQQKWCNSANEDSMSPKTLRRTGPTRFNRHGSDSESSDSDYDNSDNNDSGSNETVLQDEPSDHFNCPSELKSETSGSVEKQRRLSFQNMESNINSDVLNKSDATSVYNCLKNSNPTYDSSDRCNNYTSVQNENDGRITWEQSSENDFNQYSSKSSSKPLEARRGFSNRKTSPIINGVAHVDEINNFSAQLPDISVLQHTEKHIACNSYYTKNSSILDNSRKYKDDVKLQNYSDNPNRSDCFTWKDNKHESNGSFLSAEALNNSSDSRTVVKSNYSSSKNQSLSENDLRLELKKRLHEYTSKDEIDKNERNENRILNQNYWNKNRERNIYKNDRLKDNSNYNSCSSNYKYDSSQHRSRQERSFSMERNVSENDSELKVEVHEPNLVHDRSKPDYSNNDSKIKQGYTFSTEQNKSIHSSSHGRRRSSRSSSHERAKHNPGKEKYTDEHSPSYRRNRCGRSPSSQRSRHDCRSNSKSRLDHSSSSKRSRHGHSSSLKRSRYDRSSSLKRSRRAHSSSSKRSNRSSSSKSRSGRSSCSRKSRSDCSSSSKGSRSYCSSSSSRTKHDRSSSCERSGHEHSASPYRKCSNSYRSKRSLKSKQEHDSSCETSVHECSSSKEIKKQKRNSNEERKMHAHSNNKDGKKSDSSSNADKEKKEIGFSQNKFKNASTQRKSIVECSSNTNKDQASKSEHSQFQDHTLHQEQFLEERSTNNNKQDSLAFQNRTNEDCNINRQKDKCVYIENQGQLKLENPHRERNSEVQQKWNKERTRQHRSKSRDKSRKEFRSPSCQSRRYNSNYKRRYSRSRSRSWSSSASTSSSASSQSSRPKIRSVPSVVKSVPSKVLTAEKKDSFIDSKFETNRNLQLYTSKSDTSTLSKKGLDVPDHSKLQSSNRFGQMEGDVKANVSDSNKRVPVHMRLGVFPRKRVIQMAKDVEAAFVNSSSSDDESVSNKCKRQNIRIVTDIDTKKEDTGVEKKYSIKDRIDKRPSDIFTEKSKKLKLNR